MIINEIEVRRFEGTFGQQSDKMSPGANKKCRLKTATAQWRIGVKLQMRLHFISI